MKITTAYIPTEYYKVLKLITDKNSKYQLYSSISEAIRHAIKKMIIEDLHLSVNIQSIKNDSKMLKAFQMVMHPNIPFDEKKIEQPIECVELNGEMYYKENGEIKVLKNKGIIKSS